jgi:TetR/AcrR family transcriptional regulator
VALTAPDDVVDDDEPRDENGPAARMLAAGRRLIGTKGSDFTTQDLIREAGVALQTFYRYFGSKDQLILALFTESIRDHAAALEASARDIEDPVARLELYVRSTMRPLNTPELLRGARFMTTERWRLHQTFPAEVWAANQPIIDLFRASLEAGQATGSLSPRDPERDAWLLTKTIVGAYHHYAFQPDDPAMATLADDVWAYCLAAVGGQPGRGRASRRSR